MVEGLAFSSNGKLLVSLGDDETVKIWDVESGKELRTLRGHDNPSSERSNRSDCLYQDVENNFSCWTASTKSQLKEYIDGSHPTATRDGRLRAEGSWNGGQVVVENTTTGERKEFAAGGSVSVVALSSNGKLLASGFSNGVIKVWNLASGGDPHSLMAHTDSVTAIAVSHDNRFIATGSGAFQGASETDSIKIWDTMSGSLVRTLDDNFTDVYNIAFSKDGKRLASGSRDSVKIWDLETRDLPHTVAKSSGVNDALVFDRIGRTLFNAVDSDKTGAIRSWDSYSGKLQRSLPLNGSGILAISSDVTVLAAVSNNNRDPWLIKIADIRTGRVIAFLSLGNIFRKTDKPIFATFSPDNSAVAVAFERGKIGLWNSSTGRMLHTFEGEAPVAISPGLRYIATPKGNNIDIYDVKSGVLYDTLKGHTNKVASLCFYGNKNVLLSGSLDTITKVWDVTSKIQLASLISMDENDWLVVTPEGLFDGSPTSWRQILWRFSPQLYDVLPVETFYNDFYYPGLLTEILAGERPKPAGAITIESRDRRQPQIKIKVSSDGATDVAITNRTVKVTVEFAEAPADNLHPSKGSGVRDVRLFRNGSLVRLWSGVISTPSGAFSDDVPIVAGENKFTAYAFNRDNVKSSDADAIVNGADRLKRTSTTHIIAVGITRYDNNPYFKKLTYAESDANSFSREVAQRQKSLGREIDVAPPILSTSATRENIMAALRTMIGKVKPEDSLVIYFSGHGKATIDGRFYLLPRDIGYSTKPEIFRHSISDLDLAELMGSADAAHILLIIDACNSGQLIDDPEEKRKGPMNSKGLAQLAYDKGMYVLAAAQGYAAAIEFTELEGGLLTYTLLHDGLSSKADRDPQDRKITAKKWLDFVSESVPKKQEEIMARARAQGKPITFIDAPKGEGVPVQVPRVFYRREPDKNPFVITALN